MNGIDFTALAMALLHTLWIAGVVYCGAQLIFALLGEQRGHARHAIGFGGLVVTAIALPFMYFLLTIDPHTPAPIPTTTPAVIAVPTPPATNTTSTVNEIPVTLYTNDAGFTLSEVDWHRAACLAWIAGVAFMLLRLSRNVYTTNRFHRRCEEISNARTEHVFRELLTELGIRFRVRLLQAGDLMQPAAMGLLRPAVVLPLSMVTGLSEDQLRAVLLHELVHVRRHDYLANLIQCLIEAVLFFNPFVWMLGRMVRAERESVCDTIAAQHLGDSRQYARALLDAASLAVTSSPPLATGLGADHSKGFANRLRRLLRPNTGVGIRLPWNGLLGFGLLTGVLVASTLFVTQQSAVFTAQLLTPEERVAAIAEIEQAARNVDRGPLKLSGRVMDEHGIAVQDRVSLTVRGPNYSLATGLNRANGGFSIDEFEVGTAEISAVADGYAPTRVGPFSAAERAVFDDIEIILKPGIPNTVLVTDANGTPIPNVDITGGHAVFESSFSWNIQRTTNSDGQITIIGGEQYPIRLNLDHPGFQEATKELVLKVGGTHTWTLQEARPTTGVVYAQDTGLPLAGATVHTLYKFDTHENHGHSYGGGIDDDTSVAASTDDQGRFVLDSLSDGSVYVFSVQADGFATTLLRGVEPGQDLGAIHLNRPLSLSGRIEISSDWSPDGVHLSTNVQLTEAQHHTITRTAQVTDGTFQFDDLFPGRWTLKDDESQNQMPIDLTESRDDIFFASPAARLPVQLTISTPTGHPAPDGDIVVSLIFLHPTEGYRQVQNARRFPVVAGEAMIEVPSDALGYYVRANLHRYADDDHKDAEGLPDYYLRRTEFTIENGETDPDIEVHAEPAGAVTVKVDVDTDSITSPPPIGVMHATPDHEARMSHHDLDDSKRRSESGVTFTALPLDTTYRFHVEIDGGHVLSPEIHLDARNPIAEVVLRPQTPVSLDVTVLTPDGSPLANAKVTLNCSVYGPSFGMHRGTTDATGRVTLDNIQQNSDAEYTLNAWHESEGFAYQQVTSFRRPVTIQLKAPR